MASSSPLPPHICFPSTPGRRRPHRLHPLNSFSRSFPQLQTSRPNLSIPASLSSPPPSTTRFDLQTYWTSLIAEIDQQLEKAVPLRYPESIHEAMRYSVLARAKRAPPIMCIAACELVGGHRSHAFPTACALEMVHSASLIHDDLPCMDDDPQRRGRPSNHTVFGVDMAVLAGDALFPLGFEHMVSHTPREVPADRVLAVVAEIARTVGSTGMVAGQYLDLKLADANGGEGQDMDLAWFIKEKKFGEMAECSAVCGGLLGGASEEEVERLRRYGRAVGVLYEVVEDMMESEKLRGKEVGGERKWNYVRVYGLERARELVQRLKNEAKRELSGFEGDGVVPLYSFVDYAVDRNFQLITD
ncbi:heterodimeric geranylgeranyl pyrophosphate synthase small subunit, chloroplastic [Nymphaea colorata]|nr:heterodimeric geranylgeranyl pyrophosphate synthase small subunit, chloroplastic [Nymphaea colorata]